MAFVGEAVVGKICEMAIEAAVQQLVKEARLVVNFREDFEWLNVNLTYLRGFLTDAAGEQSKQNAAVKKWLQKIQDASMQAEDIVEECAVESLYSDSTQSCVLSCNQMIFRHRMGRKIKDVKDRISSIIEDADLLKVGRDILSPVPASSSALQRGAEWRRSSLLPIDSHPVGIDSKVDYIASLLDKSVHPVIAVVGMGGMGKTYLLQHVYNKTNQRFEISIWLSISQSYSIRNLQYDIANYIGLSKEIVEGKVSEQVAAQSIHAKLQGKKCLIVLDDVWKPVMEENLIERLGFSNNCKIVITTRNKDVCRHVDAEIYEMEYLSEEDSWELFCVYGFPHCEANRPPQHIKEVACNIVKECGKLPLAIKMTAASLSHTTLSREWAYKLRQLTEVSDLNDPMKILKLSYDCLPAHLKACFAYFCFFCEDEKIDVEYLVNLWIGEGFISEEIDQWDVGLSYLYEIADLCLVQVWEELWKGANELKKYCRVHDLLLDLAMYICKENKCAFDAQHAFTKGSSPEISGGWYRILLPKKNIGDDVVAHSRPAGSGPRLLRTLSLYGNDINNIPANMFVNMRTLRVLDLSSNHISIMPDCVGEMKLLKVLNLSHTGLREIPRCVRRLKSLRFLDASGFKLPVWIGELKCLEHIAFEYATVMPLKGISKLSSLRILRSSSALRIPFRNDESLSLEDVSNMIQLQEIGIRFDDESQWKGIEGGILGRLVKMRHFTLFNSMQMGSDLPIFPENLKAMADLEKLEIDYFAVTSCLCSFANLRELRLISCQWTNYPEFEKLPNLVNLYLNGNASCTELPKAFGKKSGFPKLRFLAVDYFYQLEEFPELEDGAMPCLELIILWGCDELKKVPEGLELLKSLKEFSYFNTGTRELRERLKEGGQDWHKIKAHNPHVIIRG